MTMPARGRMTSRCPAPLPAATPHSPVLPLQPGAPPAARCATALGPRAGQPVHWKELLAGRSTDQGHLPDRVT